MISENSQLSGARSFNCKSAAEFCNGTAALSNTEEKHGDLGMHEGAFGTFWIDKEEIWDCGLVALVN